MAARSLTSAAVEIRDIVSRNHLTALPATATEKEIKIRLCDAEM